MRFRKLFESEHLDMLHEILTSHGYKPDSDSNRVLGTGGTNMHHRYRVEKPYDHPDNELHESVHESLKSVGWKPQGEMIRREHDTEIGEVGGHTDTHKYDHPAEHRIVVTHYHYPEDDDAERVHTVGIYR